MDNTHGCLVTIAFQMWDAATAATYANVDMSLDISVASLYFTCNRPTVAALMCFAQDIEFVEAAQGSAPEASAAKGDGAESGALEAAPSGASPVLAALEAGAGATGNAACVGAPRFCFPVCYFLFSSLLFFATQGPRGNEEGDPVAAARAAAQLLALCTK